MKNAMIQIQNPSPQISRSAILIYLLLYKRTVTTTITMLLGYGNHGNIELTTCHRSTLTQFTQDTVLLGGGSRGCGRCGLGSGRGCTRSFSSLHRERRRLCVGGGGGVETIHRREMRDEGEVNDRGVR